MTTEKTLYLEPVPITGSPTWLIDRTTPPIHRCPKGHQWEGYSIMLISPGQKEYTICMECLIAFLEEHLGHVTVGRTPQGDHEESMKDPEYAKLYEEEKRKAERQLRKARLTP